MPLVQSLSIPSPVSSDPEISVAAKPVERAAPVWTAREHQAAATIARGFRRRSAVEAYDHMIANGRVWQGRSAAGGFAAVKHHSDANVRNLRKWLGPLSEKENSFVAALLNKDFYATHCTATEAAAKMQSANGTMRLYARKTLGDKQIPFNQKNTSAHDICELANDGFVFFSLEVGRQPKKPYNGFGNKMIRFNLSDNVFKDVGWMSTVDQLVPTTPCACKHIRYLTNAESREVSFRTLKLMETVFAGRDMKWGLALNIVNDARQLSPTSRDRMMTEHGDDALNALVNGLYRPEVKLPRHAFFKVYDQFDVEKRRGI